MSADIKPGLDVEDLISRYYKPQTPTPEQREAKILSLQEQVSQKPGQLMLFVERQMLEKGTSTDFSQIDPYQVYREDRFLTTANPTLRTVMDNLIYNPIKYVRAYIEGNSANRHQFQEVVKSEDIFRFRKDDLDTPVVINRGGPLCYRITPGSRLEVVIGDQEVAAWFNRIASEGTIPFDYSEYDLRQVTPKRLQAIAEDAKRPKVLVNFQKMQNLLGRVVTKLPLDLHVVDILEKSDGELRYLKALLDLSDYVGICRSSFRDAETDEELGKAKAGLAEAIEQAKVWIAVGTTEGVFRRDNVAKEEYRPGVEKTYHPQRILESVKAKLTQVADIN